jgi:hypothetical protein
MESIRVYSWKPAHTSNFGDEIGPMIVAALCKCYGVDVEVKPTISQTHKKLLAVGSVLHEARGSDVVWGVGINSKNKLTLPSGSDISFRAVRGPLTRLVAMDNGFMCPPIYGDPGLLFPMLFDKEIRARRSELELAAAALGKSMPETIVVPNINDDRFLPYFSAPEVPDDVMFIRPNLDPITVAAFISAAKTVVSSSLHGLVFADVYGRKTIRMTSQYEPEFKYSDYYQGTGRDAPISYPDVQTALSGTETPKLDWDPLPLLNAFPFSAPGMSSSLIVKNFEVKSNEVNLVGGLAEGESPFSDGWSKPDNGSVWTTQTWANFDFVVKEDVKSESALRIRVGTLKKGKGAFEVLRIIHAGKVTSSHKIQRGDESKVIDIQLPPTVAGGEINLSFKVENASSPKDYGDSLDGRKLGVWISEFKLVT